MESGSSVLPSIVVPSNFTLWGSQGSESSCFSETKSTDVSRYSATFLRSVGHSTLCKLDDTASFPPCNGHATVTLARSVYLFGGQGKNGVLSNDLWRLDDKKKWSQVGVLSQKPPPRYFHKLVANPSGGTIWLFGGLRLDRELLNDLWSFDIATLGWTLVETTGPSPPPRALHSFVMGRKSLVVHGGLEKASREAGGEECLCVWSLNTTTLRWTVNEASQSDTDAENGIPQDYPEPRYAHHCTVWGNAMYVAGGYSAIPGKEARKFQDMWHFCLTRKIWQRLQSKLSTKHLTSSANATPVRMHRCCSIGVGDTWVFVGSGYQLPVFHFPSRSWSLVELDSAIPDLCRHAVSPIPTDAKHRLSRPNPNMRSPCLVVTGGQVCQQPCNFTFLVAEPPLHVESDSSSLCGTTNSSLGPNILVVPSAGDSTVDTMSACSEQLNREREQSEVSDVMNELIDMVEGLTTHRDDLLARNTELQLDVDRWKCGVCFENDIGAIFLPCNHMLLCVTCTAKVVAERDMQCPICRERVERIVHPFLPS